MIGIYMWTNKITGESYIGQSLDIQKRKQQHIYDSKNGKYPLYISMRKYGIDNFIFSILEECKPEKLDEREQFWIKHFNTYLKGYNQNWGGQNNSCGEDNSNTLLTNEDVLSIRTRIHINNEYIKNVYNDYKDLISYDSFWQLVHGVTWKNVDCSMIKPLLDNKGEKNPRAKLSEKDVIDIRNRRYINKERIVDIYKDYKEKISYSAFEKVVLGSTWKHIPIPKSN